jgi:hypothetical protein
LANWSLLGETFGKPDVPWKKSGFMIGFAIADRTVKDYMIWMDAADAGQRFMMRRVWGCSRISAGHSRCESLSTEQIAAMSTARLFTASLHFETLAAAKSSMSGAGAIRGTLIEIRKLD